MSDTDTFDLAESAQAFAAEIEALLRATVQVGGTYPRAEMQVSYVHRDRCMIEPTRNDGRGSGLPLFVGGRMLGELEIRFNVTPDRARQHLKVVSSRFAVLTRADRTPVLRLEFDDQAMPATHWHVHGENGALSAWLALAHPDTDDVRRRWALASLHLTTGGALLRPCLEDVIELLVRDFHVDAVARWEAAIQHGRAEWRRKQLRTAVRDDPETAAAALRRLGFQVVAGEPTHAGDPNRLSRY